jgi:hypothetical protein
MSLLLQRTNHGHARNWVMGIEKQVDTHGMPHGSYNNICDPKMDEPYARSVQQQHSLPNNKLPNPGLVFDTLLKREKVQDPCHLTFFFCSARHSYISFVMFCFMLTHTDHQLIGKCFPNIPQGHDHQ